MLALERLNIFAADAAAATNIHALKGLLAREIVALGFERFSYVAMRRPNNLPGRLQFGTYPEEWVDYYLTKSLWLHDPVMHRPFHAVLPFLWSDLVAAGPDRAGVKLVFDPATDVGLRAGAAVPIHGPIGGVALLAVSKDCSPAASAALFAAQRHTLQVIAYAAHDAVVRLTAPALPAPGIQLSPRQKEVLLWTIHGKTNWEIGEILKISEDTVRQHLRAICRQLGAANRAQAVAIAVNRNILAPDGGTDRTIFLA